MPLGIELAASWVRLLRCAEIAHEVAYDLDILATAWRDVPERHRSIQAVLDHSWKLLTAGQRGAFNRLTIFSGGFFCATGAGRGGIALLQFFWIRVTSPFCPGRGAAFCP